MSDGAAVTDRDADRVRRFTPARAALAALLAVLAFGLHLSLAWRFDATGAFAQTNVLFDADPNTRLLTLTEGRHLGIKHPNMMPYFTPAVRLAADIAGALDPADAPAAEWRRALGLGVVPLASALTTALVFALFCLLGFPTPSAAVAAGLEAVSFSTLVFGSIPESYGLTALALALAYVLAALRVSLASPRGIAAWIAVGVFATGITIANVAFVAILMLASTSDRRAPLASAARAAAVAVAIFGVTGASAYILDRALTPRPEVVATPSVLGDLRFRIGAPVQGEFRRYLAEDPAARLARFPAALASSFAPQDAGRVPIRRGAGRHDLGYTLEAAPGLSGLESPLGASLLLLLAGGALVALRQPMLRRLAVGSLGILACCAALTVWGKEAFLHSQSWTIAAVVLVAGMMRAPRPFGSAVTAALLALTAGMALQNFRLLDSMLATLAQVPP